MYKFVHMVDWQTALIKPHGWQPWRRAVAKNQDIKTDIRPWRISGAGQNPQTPPHTHTGVVSACKPLTALFARGRRGNVGKVAGKIGRWHLDCIMEGRCLNAAPVSCK